MSTIPYDPSLVLGSIVSTETITRLQEIAEIENKVAKAHATLNSYIMLKRKLDMTLQDLVSMSVPVDDLMDSMRATSKKIQKAAVEYSRVASAHLPEIAERRAEISGIHQSYESPIDYNKSEIKEVPLAADSLELDAQYFSYDQNREQESQTSASLKAFVGLSSEFLGQTRSAQISTSVQSQSQSQRKSHSIDGTLVITATCTHKKACVFAPFVLNVDTALRVWNEINKDSKSLYMNVNDGSSFVSRLAKRAMGTEPHMNLLSGATYGSSFVGMVHVLKTQQTSSYASMQKLAVGLQVQFDMGAFVAKQSGGVGVDAEMGRQARSLLSNSVTDSHVSLVVMGVIPTIEASTVKLGVKSLGDGMMDMSRISAVAAHTQSNQNSVTSDANSSRMAAQLQNMKTADAKAMIGALAEVDSGTNQMLDINTMMTAFTDFVNKAIAGNVGVPINYYIKPITQKMLSKMWVAKYLPGQYIQMDSGDDSGLTDPEPAAAAAAAAGPASA